MQANDINRIQAETCPRYRPNQTIQASCDGVHDCKSNSVSIDVYSTKPTHCKVVFPHKMVRPLGRFKVNHNQQLTSFLEDVVSTQNRIKHYIADNLKRANAREALNHAARKACEYCCSSGISLELKKQETELLHKQLQTEKDIIIEKIAQIETEPSTSQNSNSKNRKIEMLNNIISDIDEKMKQNKTKKSHIVWPSSTSNGEPRTVEKIREIVEKLENNEITKEEAQGIIGRSPLLSLPNFDMVRDTPAEYLHSGCLGVVKRLIELTFSVGDKRPTACKRKLYSPALFNKLMADIKVHREFSRRVRELDFSVMKGQEFRNIILFFFPIIVKIIEDKTEKKIWIYLAYMFRSCVLPTKEFQCVNINSITNACEQFYKLYDSFYGSINCTYNTHIIGSHLLEVRSHGPLTFTSAFVFENFYGELRRSFAPGTQSNLKQMFQKTLLKRALSHHQCENTIHISDHNTEQESNNMIYEFKDLSYHMYHVMSVNGDDLLCRRVGKYPYTFEEVPSLNWSKVGVFQKGPLSSDTVVLKKSNVHGKVMQVDNLLLTCPANILREK